MLVLRDEYTELEKIETGQPAWLPCSQLPSVDSCRAHGISSNIIMEMISFVKSINNMYSMTVYDSSAFLLALANFPLTCVE